MANITIDARFYGNEHTGLGRYTTNVLSHLPAYLEKHTLHLLLRSKYYHNLKLPKNCHKVLCDVPHYSLLEQLKLPSIIDALDSNLLYTFHFNAPIFTQTPRIITIHDLIKSYFTGSDTTTRTPWLYALKRAGYNKTISQAIKRANAIIVPSNTVKNQILAHYPTTKPERIHPIPEAPDPIFRSVKSKSLILPPALPKDYLLFVGNAYPHKNLQLLLDAVNDLPSENLVVVAKRTPFLTRLLAGRDLSRIQVLSELSDLELLGVYARAKALITPSLMEGYGLVGLEAMIVGTPVLASNIPVYREVYGDKVIYFNPSSSADLVSKITTLNNNKERPLPLSFSRSWNDVAKEISEVINESCTSLRSS